MTQYLNSTTPIPGDSQDANGNYYWMRLAAGSPSEATGLQVYGNLDLSTGVLYGAPLSEWADAFVSQNQDETAGAANTQIAGTFVPSNGLGAGAHLVADAAGALTNSTAAALITNIGATLYVYNAATPPVSTDQINVQVWLNGAATVPPIASPNITISNASDRPTLIVLRGKPTAGIPAAGVLTLVSTNVTTPANPVVFSYVDFAAQTVGNF